MEYLHGGDIEAYSQENMLDYSVNIHPFGPCPEVVEAVIRSVRTQTSRYPDPFCRKLRKRLANRWEIPEKSLILGNGTDLTSEEGIPDRSVFCGVPKSAGEREM